MQVMILVGLCNYVIKDKKIIMKHPSLDTHVHCCSLASVGDWPGGRLIDTLAGDYNENHLQLLITFTGGMTSSMNSGVYTQLYLVRVHLM